MPFEEVTETSELSSTCLPMIGKKVDGLATDLEEIKEKPSKRWDTVVTVAITVIVTALVTLALTKLGL